jgi:outer membrane protein
MKTGILLLCLAIHVRIATGQPMPANNVPAAADSLAWTLQQCLAYATDHNQDLLAENQSVQAVTQERKAATAQLFPEITIKGTVDNYWKIPVQVFPGELVNQPAGTFVPVRMGTPWMGSYGADAELPLLDVPTWQRIKLARLQQQAAQGEYNALLQMLLKNVRMAYYSVLQQQEYTNVTRQLYENYQHIHALITLQLNKGLTDKIAFNQSASLLKNREVENGKAATALQQSYLDLKFWMGFPLKDPLSLAPAGELPALVVTGFTPQQLPGYEAAALKVKVAQQNYRSVRAELYPTLHIKGTWEQLGFGDKTDFITRSPWFTVGFVGLQLRLPLSLSRITYQPRSEKARWQAADLQFKKYTNEQEKKYQDEKLLLEQASRNIQLQQENIRFSKENEQLSTLKINKGIIDMIQLKEVQQDLYEAQEALNKARMEFYRHYTEINYLQNK